MKRNKSVLLLTAVGGCLLVAACSSDPATPADSTSAGSSSPAGSSSAATPGVAAAQAFADQYLANPTSIIIDTPLSKKPEKKHIVRLTTSEPISLKVTEGVQAASDALGWEFSSIPVGSDTEAIQKAFDSALQMNPQPDGIIVAGYPKVTYEAQLKVANERGIAVIAESNTDPGGTGDGIIINLDGAPQSVLWGKMTAAYMIAESEGNAQIASFNVPAYPVLTAMVTGLNEGLTEFCPDTCSIVDVDAQISDIGTKIPTSVVSTLQRDSNINWANFSTGDMAIGVSAALTAAGLTEQAQLGGQTASAANIQALRDGTEGVWTGLPAVILGWRDVDAFARYFNGDDLAPAEEAPLPTQLITQDTVGDVVLDPDGAYLGLTDYAEQFKKLWLVS